MRIELGHFLRNSFRRVRLTPSLRILDAWRPIALGAAPFRWSSEEKPERVQYLVNALYVAGTIVEREAGSGRACLRPAAADAFHVSLVHEVLDALEHESEADAHFVREMRNV